MHVWVGCRCGGWVWLAALIICVGRGGWIRNVGCGSVSQQNGQRPCEKEITIQKKEGDTIINYATVNIISVYFLQSSNSKLSKVEDTRNNEPYQCKCVNCWS